MEKRRVKSFKEFISQAGAVQKTEKIAVHTEDKTGNNVYPKNSKKEIAIQESDDATKTALVDILKDQVSAADAGAVESFVDEYITLNPDMKPEDVTVEDFETWKEESAE